MSTDLKPCKNQMQKKPFSASYTYHILAHQSYLCNHCQSHSDNAKVHSDHWHTEKTWDHKYERLLKKENSLQNSEFKITRVYVLTDLNLLITIT